MLKSSEFAAFSNILLEKIVPNFVSSTWVSLEIFVKTYRNSRTNNVIETKLGPVTKLENKNPPMLKLCDNDVMAIKYDVIVIFAIRGQFRPKRRLDSSRMIWKSYIFTSYTALNKGTIFGKN